VRRGERGKFKNRRRRATTIPGDLQSKGLLNHQWRVGRAIGIRRGMCEKTSGCPEEE